VSFLIAAPQSCGRVVSWVVGEVIREKQMPPFHLPVEPDFRKAGVRASMDRHLGAHAAVLALVRPRVRRSGAQVK
jgi:hypothetical protein